MLKRGDAEKNLYIEDEQFRKSSFAVILILSKWRENPKHVIYLFTMALLNKE